MKVILLFFTVLCFCNSTYGQDWLPFQFGQRNFLSEENVYNGDTIFNVVEFDSVLVKGDTSFFYFNTKGDTDTCISYLYDFSVKKPKACVLRDTFYFTADPNKFISSVYIPLKFPSDSSWMCHLNEEYNFTLDSAGILDFFGITDSVRYITIFDEDDNISQPDISATMVISKKHGLLKYFDFNHFSNKIWLNSCIKKLGQYTESESYGLFFNTFEDVFGLSIGDTLYYSNYVLDYVYPPTNPFYSGSSTLSKFVVKDVLNGQDSIGYLLEKQYPNNGTFYTNYYVKSDYEPFIKNYKFGFLTQKLKHGWFPENDYPSIWSCRPSEFFFGAIAYNCDVHLLDSCEITYHIDYGYSFGLAPKYGVVWEEDIWSNGASGTVLVGARLADGTQWGITSVKDVESNFQKLRIYPNPAKESFTISLPNPDGQYDLSISNVLGQKVYQKNISGNTYINTNEIGQSGIYFIELREAKANSVYTGKIIVE